MILTVEADNYYSSEVNDDLIERMGDDMNAVDYRMWGPQPSGNRLPSERGAGTQSDVHAVSVCGHIVYDSQ